MRVSASSSVAKTWRTQPSASLARSSLVGVAQALVRLGVPDQRGHAGDGGLGDGPDTLSSAHTLVLYGSISHIV